MHRALAQRREVASVVTYVGAGSAGGRGSVSPARLRAVRAGGGGRQVKR